MVAAHSQEVAVGHLVPIPLCDLHLDGTPVKGSKPFSRIAFV
jgi:hypothetical protein